MKLTKLQRYTVYCILLEESENPSIMEHPYNAGEQRGTNENGLCWMAKMIFGTDDFYYDCKILIPELYKISRKTYSYFNFNTWEERKEALKQCILETHP